VQPHHSDHHHLAVFVDVCGLVVAHDASAIVKLLTASMADTADEVRTTAPLFSACQLAK